MALQCFKCVLVFVVGVHIAYGFSPPGAYVQSTRSSSHLQRPSRCAPPSPRTSYRRRRYEKHTNGCGNLSRFYSKRFDTALRSYDEEYVIGGEPPKQPSLALKAFRAFKRGMGAVQRKGGTGAAVLVSIALLALVYHFGRIWFGKVYALAHCYFTDVYRKSVTPPWEYEKTYGCLPPGANPETYGKIIVKVDGKEYLKSGGPPDWPVKAGANLSAWSKRQLGIPVPIDWQRLTMLLSFLGGFLIYFIRNTR